MSELMTEHDGCVNCMYEDFGEEIYPCNKCKQNYTDKYKRKPVKTRGDAIRESNESLVEFFGDFVTCRQCVYTAGECDKNCPGGFLGYLNQPAESEE